MVATSDLKMDWDTVTSLLLDENDDDVEVSVSPRGCLFLLAGLAWRSAHRDAQNLRLSVLPDHDRVSTAVLGDPTEAMSTDVSSATVDALLLTGWLAFDTGGLAGDAAALADEPFNRYLQKLSALAATHEMPSLRSQAHFFMSTVLHAHSSSAARLAFIDDTLHFCPFPNLKEAAVGWAKTEFLSACEDGSESNVFKKPETLDHLAQLVFDFDAVDMSPEEFLGSMAFVHAALNFLSLLCTSPSLSTNLAVKAMIRSCDLEHKFVEVVGDYGEQVREDLIQGASIDINDLLELDLLKTNLDRAREGITHLYQSSSPR